MKHTDGLWLRDYLSRCGADTSQVHHSVRSAVWNTSVCTPSRAAVQ